MNEVLEILAAHRLKARFQMYYAYDAYVAHLDVGHVHYCGMGDTPATAIEALLANIREVSPVEVGVVAG